MHLKITETKNEQGDLVITVLCEIDVYTTPRFKERAYDVLDNPVIKVVALRLDEVRYIDSTGLGALIGIHKRARELQKSFYIYDEFYPNIRRLLEITGLNKFFNLGRPAHLPESTPTPTPAP